VTLPSLRASAACAFFAGAGVGAAPVDAAGVDAVMGYAVGGEAAPDGSLLVAPIEGDSNALGAFQRARSALDLDLIAARGTDIVRRATGGPAIRLRLGHLYVALRLARADALGGADVARALNRHVRPLLRALGSLGVPASWGGRDVVLARGTGSTREPVAWVGVRHRRATNEVGVEAVVAVDSPFVLEPILDLAHAAIAPRFLGRAGTTLTRIVGRDLDAEVVGKAVVEAYAAQAAGEISHLGWNPPLVAPIDLEEAPFTAMIEESIGLLGARVETEHARVSLGGDLMVSEDVLDPLGRALFALGAAAGDEAIGAVIDEHLAPTRGALLVGVRSLGSFVRLVRAAWDAHAIVPSAS
jgi:hypothetical protein